MVVHICTPCPRLPLPSLAIPGLSRPHPRPSIHVLHTSSRQSSRCREPSPPTARSLLWQVAPTLQTVSHPAGAGSPSTGPPLTMAAPAGTTLTIRPRQSPGRPTRRRLQSAPLRPSSRLLRASGCLCATRFVAHSLMPSAHSLLLTCSAHLLPLHRPTRCAACFCCRHVAVAPPQ